LHLFFVGNRRSDVESQSALAGMHTMNARQSDRSRAVECADQLLRTFAMLFERNGWLNRKIRIAYGGATYRIFCSRLQFFVYRINDGCRLSPGVPGWPVFMIGEGEIFEDRECDRRAAVEPGATEWLECLTNPNLEVILEGYE
jgi:hypothetical protein